MKVALLISGYLRGYETNMKFIQDEIINKFSDVDIYLHITKDENTEDKYLNQIEESDIKLIINTLNPITTIIENNNHYSDDKSVNNVRNHWSKLYKLNQLKLIKENETSKYDLVIRYRPDLNIKSENIFDIKISYKTIYIPKDAKIDKLKLINITDGYLCDALAFGSSESMDKYFDIYNHYGPNMPPVSETALFNYLKTLKYKYELIDVDYSFTLSKCNVFAICGDSGSGKTTLSSLLKGGYSDSFMLECDRYHKWERHNENWKEMTHLNPEANYIAKMEEDIFNLKVGKDIYQVDYDHHTGKFTEKQLINTSNNLIVCGLHSLYGSNKLYDVKIFMDTEESLKTKWKIKRDVVERGYTIEKVLESIKKRKGDYKEYVLPQKNIANIIVRFFTTDVVNFDDLDQQEKLSLEISVSNNCDDIKNIINTLSILGIKYEHYPSDEFTKFIFYDYQELKVTDNNLNYSRTGTFYDYILFYIFNLNFTN